jgi:hypothetical protein
MSCQARGLSMGSAVPRDELETYNGNYSIWIAITDDAQLVQNAADRQTGHETRRHRET